MTPHHPTAVDPPVLDDMHGAIPCQIVARASGKDILHLLRTAFALCAVSTAFRCRHRFLTSKEGNPTLTGIVEADEAFVLLSFKGSRVWERAAVSGGVDPALFGGGAIRSKLPGRS